MTKPSKKKTKESLADPSAADAFTTVEVPEVLWQAEPAEHDYPAADSYLRLITAPANALKLVAKLQKAPLAHHPAKDVLRAAQLPLLPMDDPAVKRDITEVIQGKKLSPVLIVRGEFTSGVPLTIADGYHRVCASYHLSENELIPCRIIDA